MYNALYKCRLCGEEYTDYISSSSVTAKKAMLQAVFRIENNIEQCPNIRDIHFCKDGSYGVADLKGMICEKRETVDRITNE